MTSNTGYDQWLRQLTSDGKGGTDAPFPAIVRGQDYAVIVSFAADFSDDEFAASIRSGPGGNGAPVADFTVTVGAFVGGVTPVTLSLAGSETADLLADDNRYALAWFVYDLLHTPAGASAYRIVGGEVPVSGEVTSA